MGDLTKHFSRYEFSCKCGCGTDTVDAATLALLEVVRKYFKQLVSINSGCRCASHNANVGGASDSQHLTGRACDIVVNGVPPEHVANYLDNGPLKGKGGIGRYDTFTHLDTRSNGPARWSG